MRLTYLLLSLSLVVMSGCACDKNCRLPLLSKVFGTRTANTSAESNVSSCGCDYCRQQSESPVETSEQLAPITNISAEPPQYEYVSEPVQELPVLQPIQNNDVNSFSDDLILQSPIQVEPVQQSTPEIQFKNPQELEGFLVPDNSPSDIVVPDNSAPLLEPSNNLPGMIEPETDFETSILESPKPKIKAIPISSPTILNSVKPEPHKVMSEEEAIETSTTPLPAAAEPVGQPLVLHARPVLNHRINNQKPTNTHWSVADASSLDQYGLPNSATIQFQELPPINQDQQKEKLNLPQTKLPSLPSVDEMPVVVPDENKNQAASYSGPLTEEKNDNRPYYVQNPSSRGQATSSSTKNADPMAKIVSAQTIEKRRVPILRLQASTPLDHYARRQPLVSLSHIEPVIVRGTHPSVNLPEPPESRSRATITRPSDPGFRPVFDTDKLNKSFRGLSLRPKLKPKTKLGTIER